MDRLTTFTLEELRQFPAVTRAHCIECAGNGRAALPGAEPQEGTASPVTPSKPGVAVATLLREVGVRRGANWAFAEGGDAAVLSRSVPMEKLLDDSLIVYARNGEPLDSRTATPRP